jgi:polyisoprenoid-binding protein YceI
MKKSALIFTLFVIFFAANAQKYMTRTGYTGFYSHTPMEDIKADNNQVASVLDVSTGELVFQVLIKSFRFEKALMEVHFNENYMESDKYPRASFKGKITNIQSLDLTKAGKYDVTVEGELNLHNVTKNISVTGTLEVAGGGITASSKFNISPEDYKINIPGVVRDKIAKSVEVTVTIKYSPVEIK